MERFNRTLKVWLKEAGVRASIQSDLVIRLASYKATPHSSTGCSPSELLHGRKIRLRLPVIATCTVGMDVTQRVGKQQRRNEKHVWQASA